MANGIHKGTELNNVKETWQQNERTGKGDNSRNNEPAAENDLEKVVRKEAEEYDSENKADRVLPGERATVNDDNSDE